MRCSAFQPLGKHATSRLSVFVKYEDEMRGRSSELSRKQLQSPPRMHQIRQMRKLEVQIPLNGSPSPRPLISVCGVQIPARRSQSRRTNLKVCGPGPPSGSSSPRPLCNCSQSFEIQVPGRGPSLCPLKSFTRRFRTSDVK